MSVDVGKAVGYLDLDTTGFKKGLSGALQDLKVFQDQNATAADKWAATSSAMGSAGKSLTMGVTVPLALAGAGALKFSADFGSQMSNVAAITQANTTEMQAMKDMAIDLGATTAFSASEAAEGMANLGSAGFTTKEIMAAMPGMLDLAASSGTDLATASEIAATALRGFGLEASDSGRVADLFAKAAAETNAGVEDMGEAMKFIAPVANAMGLSIEETAAAVGILSDAGIKGGQAGTTLRGALSRLASPSKEAADSMAALGFAAYDSDGKMKGLDTLIGDLNTSMVGLTDEQKQNAIVNIFGQEAMSGIMVLMDAGPEKIDGLTKSFEDSDGAAADMAKTMQDNLKGSLDQLGGAVESLGISVGDILTPFIRALAEALGNFVTWLNGSSQGVKTFVIALAVVLAAIGPILLITAKVITTVQTLLPMFGLIAKGFKAVTAVMAANPFVLIVGAIVLLVLYIRHLWKTNKDFRDGIKGIWKSIKDTVLGIGKAIGKFFTDLPKNIGDALMKVITGIDTWRDNLVKAGVKAVVNLISGMVGLIKTMPQRFKALWKDINVFFDGIPAQFFNIGKNIITGLWNGMKAIWTGIVSWFADALESIRNFLAGAEDGKSRMQGHGGSRASDYGWPALNGLAYVPYDGFQATLHEGERVLTKQQNQQGGSEVRHSGTVRVEGVNNKGELVAVTEMLMSDVTRGERRNRK